MHLACWFGHIEIVKSLLAAQASIDQVDRSGKTPLHCCAWFGNKMSAQLLLEKKASFNIQDRGGDTPLHFACQHGFKEIVIALLHIGADPKLKNGLGQTPEDVAEQADRSEIIEIMEKREDSQMNKTRVGLLEIDKAIVHEQKQLNKTLDDMVAAQEKQLDFIKVLKQKLQSQAGTVSVINAQIIDMRKKLEEMTLSARQISDQVNALSPPNTSRGSHRFNFSRVASKT